VYVSPTEYKLYGKVISTRGNNYHDKKDDQKALADFRQVLRLDPDNVKVCHEISSFRIPESETLLRKAAEMGYAPAQIDLGRAYEFGDYGLKNLQKAREWYSKAAARGSGDAIKNIERLDHDAEFHERWVKKRREAQALAEAEARPAIIKFLESPLFTSAFSVKVMVILVIGGGILNVLLGLYLGITTGSWLLCIAGAAVDALIYFCIIHIIPDEGWAYTAARLGALLLLLITYNVCMTISPPGPKAEKTQVPSVTELLDRGGTVIQSAIPLDAKSEDGKAKIFRISYAKDYTVIGIMRTTGEHREVGVTGPGTDNAFYIEDADSGKRWPLMALQKFDEEAAGADLIFGPAASRHFSLIEGADKSETAWHFRNVVVPE
jgi:tetratricopeptide (TPR) repeat protein